ncbi:hypothetical protein TNIN_327501 [Trichonephila inaurata madagascariensis]|uniref:Uncharacterized protein n=1 Tax=Trichonephila inaurata madagascariensis TaxID=2747483 RepID=A0A8X6WR14_9ARAC|nr:hypothetical protein TNIN_327501 [Trichonephila inaurata madagascariensis]
MSKIGICTQLPFKLILGFDWQQQIQARCTYDLYVSLCIFLLQLHFICTNVFMLPNLVSTSSFFFNCHNHHLMMLPCQKQHQMPFHLKQNSSLNPEDSTIQQAQLDAENKKFTEVFYSNDDNFGHVHILDSKSNYNMKGVSDVDRIDFQSLIASF